MGMFDYLICDAPLPGDPPAFAREPGHRFQTKDLSDTMAVYRITADGTLRQESGGWIEDEPRDEAVPHHGTLDFYDGNSVASAYGFTFTQDGEDSEWAEYRATFDHGRLTGIEVVRQTREPALPVAELKAIDAGRNRPWTAEEKATWEARQAESLIGRSMYYASGSWKGEDGLYGYPLEIVAESGKEWVGRGPDGTFEVIDRRDRDRTFFDSREAAEASRREDREEKDRQKARLTEMLAAKLARRSGGAGP